ncbi:uncharacterized protein A1O9_09126 [Exophiala aquamarina CBS 119918]|uniref:Chromo domain-containing protein n=1 Tax=Exophiala aquamarina CBS 119918 TaxID=1182545 RepID=A0A072P3I1_9EURO|nr:uncharacterized protein A1O9_09126 [Exophiala aquamarina CBS 119918]KEF54684.1 hypothetical protein A1O9_09126 [Exophiala aquamarina CBS 119918]
MKKPYKPNLVEYSKSSTKRKKPSDTPTPITELNTAAAISYSERKEVPWEEQRTLPKRFHESGIGTWPALRIINERGSGKKREYLLEWEPHPYTKEVFRPDWTAATSVGVALVEAWKNQKNPLNQVSGSSNASDRLANLEERRKRVTHTIQDSSSEPGSQNITLPTTAAPPAKTSKTPDSSNPRRGIPLSFLEKSHSVSSPLEIAETQQETSQQWQRQLVSVDISPPDINTADYESLRSSQINSAGGIDFSSPLKSQLIFSQPERTQSSAKSGPIPVSTLLTNRQKNGLKTANKNPPSKLNPSSSVSANGQQPLKSSPDPVISSGGPRASVSHPESSPTSSKFGTPEYVPSTNQDSPRGRAVSIELGSQLGSRRNGQALKISDLIIPESDSQILVSQNQAAQPASQASIPRNSFPSPLPQGLQTSNNCSKSLLQLSNQANSNPHSQGNSVSSPWEFRTQHPVKETSAARNLSYQDHNLPTTLGKRLLQPFNSPIRSGGKDSTQLRQAQASPPGSTTSPLTLRERLRQARASTTFADLLSNTDIETHTNDMDMSPASSDTSPAAGGRHDRSRESPLESSSGAQGVMYDNAIGGSALPIQKSIEQEQLLNDEQDSEGSKGSSSQQSVENERDIAQVDGLVLPSLPLLGPSEYALGLPAEGKIQSVYADIIKTKKKAILKFINRHEAIGSGNTSPNRTHERNEMNELIQLLHNTTTHLDLGLPGISTQYSINPEQHAAYANYAGSKFSLLGHLVDTLKRVSCSIVIAARSGVIQDLLEQYLETKEINVKRHDRRSTSQSPDVERPHEFQVELMSTMSDYTVNLTRTPILMIAFDASFDAQDPQIKRVRTLGLARSRTLVPVVHLLVTNSSEHVDLCIPKSLPSPIRLKLLVRATYQARPNLGGKPTYVPNPSDEPQGRAMDFSDLQRALRKSPERKLYMLASIITQAAMSSDFDSKWGLGSVSELQLTEVTDSPPKVSGTSTVAETPKDAFPRSRTPVSRADTPSGKKRLLEVENAVVALNKRQRLTPTPLRETENGKSNVQVAQPVQAQDLINKLQAELTKEREARLKAEEEKEKVQLQLDQWKSDHAALLRRYEKRMKKCHEQEKTNTKLVRTIENNKSRQERTIEDNTTLKEKVKGLQQELNATREAIKYGGGDAATVEVAREEARSLLAKNMHLEKSLENTRKDFEFTRAQYQEASNKAAEFANQARDLEEKVSDLSKQAGDEKRRLREMNYQESLNHHLSKIAELEQEKRTRDVLLKKIEEENRQLKRNRGVQTRGSSAQPPGSPGLDAPSGSRGPRSRQNSPAPGLFPHHGNTATNRGSLLRHER